MRLSKRISVVRVSNSMLVTYYGCAIFLILSLSTMLLVSSSEADGLTLKMKPNKFTRVAKTRYNSGKAVAPVKKEALAVSSGEKKVGVIAERSSSWKSDSVLPRQGGGWGWGYPSSYGGGGGSYDSYTIIAVAAFAALFGGLIYALLGGTFKRSLETPSFNIPPMTLGLDSDKFPEVMVRLGEWIANSSWFDNVGSNSNSIRDLGEKLGVRKWFQAYKKDPVEFQCVRKIACETLASSQLASKSLKSSIGDAFLTIFGNFIEDGDELSGLVKEIVGNPDVCEEMIFHGYCEEN